MNSGNTHFPMRTDMPPVSSAFPSSYHQQVSSMGAPNLTNSRQQPGYGYSPQPPAGGGVASDQMASHGHFRNTDQQRQIGYSSPSMPTGYPNRKYHRNHHYYHQSNFLYDQEHRAPQPQQVVIPNPSSPPTASNPNFIAQDMTAKQTNPEKLEKLSKQELFRRELDEQIRMKQERKNMEKCRARELDEKERKESEMYNPFGRGGAGAPLRDASGHVVADLRNSATGKVTATKISQAFEHIPVGAKGPPTTFPAQTGYPAGSYGGGYSSAHAAGPPYPSSRVSPRAQEANRAHPVPPTWQTGGMEQVPGQHEHANTSSSPQGTERHTRFQFDRAPPEVQHRIQERINKQLEFQQTLQAQLDDKKRRKQEEHERQMMEERREEERIAKERQEMQMAYDREHGKVNLALGGNTAESKSSPKATRGNTNVRTEIEVKENQASRKRNVVPDQSKRISDLEREVSAQATQLSRLQRELEQAKRECERWKGLAQQNRTPHIAASSNHQPSNSMFNTTSQPASDFRLETNTVFVPAHSAPVNAVLAGSRGQFITGQQNPTSLAKSGNGRVNIGSWNPNSGEETDQLDRLLRDFVQQNENKQ